MSGEKISVGQKGILAISTLGHFSVKAGNVLISEKTRKYSKTWEVFKYFLTQKEQYIIPERVMETLWPEKEYAEPRTTFRYHVHKLRNILKEGAAGEGSLRITSTGGGYLLEVDKGCWIDSEEFENLSREAEELSHSNIDRAIDKYIRALTLYQGFYLPEVTGSWIVPVQQYYKRLYLKGLENLFDLLRSINDYSTIMDCCEKAFAVEPYEEDIHLNYIEALVQSGKKERARIHYEDITGTLYRESGRSPGSEMRNIYQFITDAAAGTNNIKKKLQEREESNGALICDPHTFYYICRREKRCVERNGAEAYLGILTLSTSDVVWQLEEIVNTVERIIKNNLRKGDVVTREKHRFVILFSGSSFEQLQAVLLRIQSNYKQACPNVRAGLQANVQSLLSW